MSFLALNVLQLEEVYLCRKSPGKAGKRPGGADDAVAWHDDGERISSDGSAHRTRGGRPSNRSSDLLIAPCFSGTDGPQHSPYVFLKVRSAEE